MVAMTQMKTPPWELLPLYKRRLGNATTLHGTFPYMSLRGTLALLLLASLMLAPLSGAWAQEVLGTTLPEVPQEPVVPEEIPEPEELLVSPEETPSRTISDESGDVTAPTIIQAKALYNPTERSAGPKSKIKEGLTIIQINISDELNESPDVRVDFSLLGGSSSVRPNEGISSLFNKYIYYDGPAITVPDGTYYLPYTASDPHGNTVAGTVPITIDETSPTIENFVVSYPAGKTAATSTDTLTLSGSFSDVSSPAATKVFDALVYEYDEAGLPAYFVPTSVGERLTPRASSVSAGAFSFELPLSSALLEGGFKPNAKTFDIVFYVQDGAGLITTATSTRLLIGDSVAATTTGVSNVLFLPGIKGSRLYDANDNKLWEPEGNQDVENLFLTSTGVGANTGIHTKSGDIIETIAGFSEIYGSFIRSMNELQTAKTIKEWRIVSYDWRLSLDDIVNKGAVREDNIYFDETADIPYIERNLLELASSSPTHRVTIIAHSNGGLVAKKLMMKLGDTETARLIDKVIFVGVPQSGAPQALGALLFGYKESLPSWFPFIVHTSTARTFAENSPMGYHLLPSQRYFDDVFDQEHAVVRFKAVSTYAEERAEYGNVINTWEELRAFSLAEDNGRVKPEAVVFSKPNVLNDFLLTYAKRTHDSIDAWVPPADVTLYQIGGWGKTTVSGIEFYELCVLSVCKKEYRPMFVEDGDGVVPIPSALMLSTTTDNIKRFWVNLDLYGFGPIGNKNHGNILSVTDMQIFLQNILLNDSSLPENILTSQPAASITAKQLRFMLHSPLTLNLYDSSGNHTGPTENESSEETIPGSEYGQFGEVQYIIVPAGPEYRVEMNGVASGTFSLDIQEVSDGSVVASTTLASVPTQAGTIATMTIGDSLEAVSNLSVDLDGNGSADFQQPVSQNSTSFYQASVETVTEPTSSGGSSKKSSAISTVQETPNVTPTPSLGLPITLVAQQQTKQPAQVAVAIQKEPSITTQPAESEPNIDRYSLIASPLSAFYEVKDILISMLVGVYHFIIRIGSFLFTH
jgi:pimeloyl-ACP methyl ester carboxylesterase